jgi:stage V sporulation protein B
MAAAAKAVLFAAQNLLHLPSVICIALTVGVAVIVYAVLVISLRTLTKDDVMLLPKGEKVAKFLKIQ